MTLSDPLVSMFLIGIGILFTNLESRGTEKGSSMDLVACLLTS